ncbi:MAG: SDR family oxidoreductase [Actinomycetota bacterium]
MAPRVNLNKAPLAEPKVGRLEGRVALISGGARGMGASHARLLAVEGASVVIGDVLDHVGRALASEIGPRASYVHLDVTSPTDWLAAVNHTVQKFGSLDVLVNNAGIVISRPIEDLSIAEWQRTIDINLTGVFLGMKSAMHHLKTSGNGSIINISSVAGLQGFSPAYTASKFGVRGITKAVAVDVGRFNIRVNSIHPGLIKTAMLADHEAPQDHVALHRVGHPSEVSNLVVYLASEESSYSTGAEFIVDGGESAGRASLPAQVS